MPNWCVNKVIVEGPEEMLSEFLKCSFEEEKEGKLFVFEAVDPKGKWENTKHLNSELKEMLGEEWMSWGVTCNPYVFEQEIIEQTPTRFYIEFKTRWSPPCRWAENVIVQERFKDLKVTVAYCEAGMDFYGSISVRKGEIQKVHGEIGESLKYIEDENNKIEQVIHWDTPFGEFVKKWEFIDFGG